MFTPKKLKSAFSTGITPERKNKNFNFYFGIRYNLSDSPLKSPRSRVDNFLPSGSYQQMTEHGHMQRLEANKEVNSALRKKSGKRKRNVTHNKTMILTPTKLKDKQAATPAEPYKFVIVSINGEKPKKRANKVANNNTVMKVPATNPYNLETYYRTIDNSGKENRVTFEHTHLFANHFRHYHTTTVLGDVNPNHPDNPMNLVEAPKNTNSQMMSAEMVVDAIIEKIHQRASKDGTSGGRTAIIEPIKTEHEQFNEAFNHALGESMNTECVLGCLTHLLKDDEGDITHVADKIEYFIGYRGEFIRWIFHTRDEHGNAPRTPSVKELHKQRQQLENFFRRHFDESYTKDEADEGDNDDAVKCQLSF